MYEKMLEGFIAGFVVGGLSMMYLTSYVYKKMVETQAETISILAHRVDNKLDDINYKLTYENESSDDDSETSSGDDEVETLFENEEHKRFEEKSESLSEKIRQLKTKGFQEVKILKRMTEKEILEKYKFLVGMDYDSAIEKIKHDQYSLHVLYVNGGIKKALPKRNPNVIGVRINDDSYDFYHNLPGNATISELIDVGGVDISSKGMVL